MTKLSLWLQVEENKTVTQKVVDIKTFNSSLANRIIQTYFPVDSEYRSNGDQTVDVWRAIQWVKCDYIFTLQQTLNNKL